MTTMLRVQVSGEPQSNVLSQSEIDHAVGGDREIIFEPIRSVPSNCDIPDFGSQLVHVESNASQYERFSRRHKIFITCIVSFCGFLSPMSSTTVLAAVPEVAATYNTSGSIINLSNAFYMLAMGIASCFWGPISNLYGRRWVCITSALQFFGYSIGTALAPNLALFFVFRVLTALQGTSLLIVGNACLGDIYTPTSRATAIGWFSTGTIIAPAFSPFLGGVIVTFRSWRTIFWVQSALAGLATLLLFGFLPETAPERKIDALRGRSHKERTLKILSAISPLQVGALLFGYPNLLVTGLASSALVWNMYSLLTPIRYVLNPRFNLTTPLESGLFYIAPGCGYFLGTLVGGRWADLIVKKWIVKRGQKRIAEDRLRSCYFFLGLVMPTCILIYGWSVDAEIGGVPLPAAAMFFQGVAQLFCFPSLNTYCLDVFQSRGLSAEVIAGNYMMRYFFAALGSALCLPAVQRIGVGWFSTLSAAFLAVSGLGVWATSVWGTQWSLRVQGKRDTRQAGLQSDPRELYRVQAPV